MKLWESKKQKDLCYAAGGDVAIHDSPLDPWYVDLTSIIYSYRFVKSPGNNSLSTVCGRSALVFVELICRIRDELGSINTYRYMPDIQ